MPIVYECVNARSHRKLHDGYPYKAIDANEYDDDEAAAAAVAAAVAAGQLNEPETSGRGRKGQMATNSDANAWRAFSLTAVTANH